ncbi:MAG TPA: tyrosine-type recombinase/integrase [Nitrososphaera sp.]|nr:tyrosine-type recombinase/integrase [Nitrososphaera sp.]
MERQQEPEIRHVMSNSEDPNFDRKLDLVTAGAHPYIKEHLLTRITKQNCFTIITYVLGFMTEVNPSQEHRIITIYKLKLLAEYYHPKSFEELTGQDLVEFLDRIRKPESVDPLHKWIGTYNHTRVILLRFFRWLYRPSDDIKPNKRPIPAVMQQIPNLKRHEISIYKPTDLWTEEDDAIFYKYCPSVRDRCWHAVSRDTGCRPSELLRLKIKDVVVQQLENGYQVARITVNGKTGTRHVRLNNSYPRLKDWLRSGHPYPGNPSAPLFCGLGKKNTGKKLARNTMFTIYNNYKKVHFSHLLKDPMVPEEDKRKITELLKKPWNPYIRRHTAATEISKALKDSVLIDQYMGWSHASNTRQKYQHYYNDDSFDAILTMMDGLTPPSTSTNNAEKGLLHPKQCPNCSETNTPESKFCSKCKFVLSFDAFNERVNEAESTNKRLERLEKTISSLTKVALGMSDTFEVHAPSAEEDPDSAKIFDEWFERQQQQQQVSKRPINKHKS